MFYKIGSWPRCLLRRLGVEVTWDLESSRCWLRLTAVGRHHSDVKFGCCQNVGWRCCRVISPHCRLQAGWRRESWLKSSWTLADPLGLGSWQLRCWLDRRPSLHPSQTMTLRFLGMYPPTSRVVHPWHDPCGMFFAAWNWCCTCGLMLQGCGGWCDASYHRYTSEPRPMRPAGHLMDVERSSQMNKAEKWLKL